MEVRVEGRGLEVRCHRDTNRVFYAVFLFFVFMTWHGLWFGFGIIGRVFFFFLVPEIS